MRSSIPFCVLLVAAAPCWSQASVAPTDVQLPGTQPKEVTSLESPTKCDNCHSGYDTAVEPTYNWSGSMMSQAARDPVFWPTLAVAESDFPGAGDFCVRCHSPEGWYGGRSEPTDGSGLASGDQYGVICDACHQMTNPDDSELLGVQNAPFVANDGGSPAVGYYGSGMLSLHEGSEKLGPYQDPASPHQSLPSRFHREAEFCGSCHDVSNPVVGDLSPGHGHPVPLDPGTFSGVPGAPVEEKAAFNNFPYEYGIVERTFSEHMASAFPTLDLDDYDLLPAELQDGAIEKAWLAATASTPDGDYVDGTDRTFTCQTCHMPPVQGYGCNKPSAPLRDDLPLHDMTGANAWGAAAILWLESQGRLVLGNGLSSTEVLALQSGADRATATLQSAASLAVSGDTLTVTNLTGHKYPTGYPEGRRSWLHVRWYDGVGNLVREDGAYGTTTVTHDGAPLAVDTILDLGDPHLVLYDVHYGMTREWASTLVALGVDPTTPLTYDRTDDHVVETLGNLAASPAGTVAETFHFAWNDSVVYDHRIPPYGMRYDDARVRGTLPVPEGQYGSPGPGGTFLHQDVIDLDPPARAATATIELLYQSTSWEYVQFLDLANRGAVAFLATTGQDLLDAWLATGMAAPIQVATATWSRGGPFPRADVLLQGPPTGVVR